MEYPNSKPFRLRGDFKKGDVFHAHVDYFFKGAHITYVGNFVVLSESSSEDGRIRAELQAVSQLNHCLPFVVE